MLQAIRDKITGWVAGIVIAIIAVVFIFWGVDFGASASTYAAKVDGERIPIETVQRAWQQRRSQLQQMLRDELPEDMAKQQQAALLDQFVQQTLLTNRAEEFGYHVSDQALAQRVMEVPQFQVDGEFSKDRYNALVRASGLSETQFEDQLRREMLMDQIQSGVVDSAFVTPSELARRYALERQEREVAYALIPAGDFAANVSVTDEQVQAFYEQNKSRFLTPETVDVQYIELTRDQAQGAVAASEEELRDYYEQNKERFESPERRRARHILITTDEKVDEAAAERLAQELAEKAQGGANFAALAKEYSKDPGSAEQGGDLGWAQRGMFVGPFEEALFAMSPGEIRGPVKTQFGYHVLKLEEVERGAVQSFEQVRAELEDEFRRERSETLFYDQTQKMADLAFSSLTELESVAKTMNLPLKTMEGFTREGGGDLGQERSVIETVFSEDVLQRRENSPLLAIGEDRAVILRVTDHQPAEPRPLEEIRAQIEAQLKVQAARDAAAEKGAAALARLQQGEAWAEVVKSMDLSAIDPRFIGRNDAVAPEAVAQAAFNAPKAQIGQEKPYFTGVATDDGNYAVLRVTDVRSGDPQAEAQQEKTARRRRAERQTGVEEFSGYLAEAERTAEIVRNDNLFE